MVMMKECKTNCNNYGGRNKIWREEVEKDLSIMGIKNRWIMARDWQSGME
jgi:hypothetical protein